jgi:hypothetical protein
MTLIRCKLRTPKLRFAAKGTDGFLKGGSTAGRSTPLPPGRAFLGLYRMSFVTLALPWRISTGANVKAVQTLLGHASAVMTLDLYVHLLSTDLTKVATALNRAARKAAA